MLKDSVASMTKNSISNAIKLANKCSSPKQTGLLRKITLIFGSSVAPERDGCIIRYGYFKWLHFYPKGDGRKRVRTHTYRHFHPVILNALYYHHSQLHFKLLLWEAEFYLNWKSIREPERIQNQGSQGTKSDFQKKNAHEQE